jgi:ribosomal protein L37E
MLISNYSDNPAQLWLFKKLRSKGKKNQTKTYHTKERDFGRRKSAHAAKKICSAHGHEPVLSLLIQNFDQTISQLTPNAV